jgi:hypothetical protein
MERSFNKIFDIYNMRKFNSILENKNNADVYSVQLNSELIYAMYEGSQVGSLILCYHGQKHLYLVY